MATVNISAMAKTWNDAGTTFTAIKMDVTDTASNAASLLLDLQVGGSSQFTVAKDGGVLAKNGTQFVPGYSFQGNSTYGMSLLANSQIYMISGGSPRVAILSNQLRISGTLGWAVTNAANGADTILDRDAAANLALRNSTTAQTFRVYGTYTNSSNYERLAITRDAITVESAGTGAANIDLALTPAGTGVVKFGAHTTLGGESVTGYITIKDAGGTSRKIAVVS